MILTSQVCILREKHLKGSDLFEHTPPGHASSLWKKVGKASLFERRIWMGGLALVTEFLSSMINGLSQGLLWKLLAWF